VTTLALWVVVLGGFYLLLEVLCSERGASPGPTWFDIAPTLTVSKKKRGRGEVNRDGLTRYEQSHGRFSPRRGA